MRKSLFLSIVIVLASLLMPAVQAKVTLSPLFTDHMVLQQNSSVPVWGKAAPGANVTVTPSWTRSGSSAVADAEGNWMVQLKTPKGSFKEYSITISDGTPVVLQDVLVGEVWLCSGQSNMQMPMESWRAKRINQEDIHSSDQHPYIRLLHVRRNTGMSERDTFVANFEGWNPPSSKTVRNFSAVAWYFGVKLQEMLKVPVGLVNSSEGGTRIEAWMSLGALKEFPEMAKEVEEVEVLSEEEGEREKSYQGELYKLLKESRANDIGLKEHWEKPSLDDASWSDITLPSMIQNLWKGVNGVYWFRKEVEIPAAWEGRNVTLSLGPIDDYDETFWNGVQVGCDSVWNLPREYVIPASMVKAGRTVITIRNTDDHGNGGLYGAPDQLFLQGPDGQKIGLDNTWKVKLATSFENIPVNKTRDTNIPSVLYNGMISPLAPYRIAGALWYQGEANATGEKAVRYRDMMARMIQDWRQAWGYDFPFYITQLANYYPVKENPSESDWAVLRESQSVAALHVSGVDQACIIDIGEADDIHPVNKQDAADRLVRLALARQYGQHKLVSNGPRMQSYELRDGYVSVTFSDVADGLCVRTSGDFAEARYGAAAMGMDRVEQAEKGVLSGFQIAGPDGTWHWANAEIVARKKSKQKIQEVLVSSPEVKHPVAVRYAWEDNPVCNLYNSEGLPAWPFRTDL